MSATLVLATAATVAATNHSDGKGMSFCLRVALLSVGRGAACLMLQLLSLGSSAATAASPTAAAAFIPVHLKEMMPTRGQINLSAFLPSTGIVKHCVKRLAAVIAKRTMSTAGFEATPPVFLSFLAKRIATATP